MPINTLNGSLPTPAPGSHQWFMARAYADWLAAEHQRLCAHMGWQPGDSGLTPITPDAMPSWWRAGAVMEAAGIDLYELAAWAREAAGRAARPAPAVITSGSEAGR